MTIKEAIQKAYLTSNGKTTTLDVNSPRYMKFLALANVLQDDWLSEPDTQWVSRYDHLSLGTITSDRVDLDDSIYEFSKLEGDRIYTKNSTNQRFYYDLVTPLEMMRYRYKNVCAPIQGQLVFTKTFSLGTPEYGYEVFVPVTIKLDSLVLPTDEIQVDDPNWLVYMMAAEQVRNTVTKSGQFANIIAKANNIMLKMKQKNEGQLSYIPMSPSVLGESWSMSGSYGSNYGNSAGQPLGENN